MGALTKRRPSGADRLAQGVLPRLLGYWLRLAQQAAFRDFAQAVKGFSPGQVGILVLINANPGVTQSRLAEAVGLDRSTLVGVLHTLQGRGLVARRRGEDRRTNGLTLTPAGRSELSRARGCIAVHERRFASRLSAQERTRLLVLLRKLSR